MFCYLFRLPHEKCVCVGMAENIRLGLHPGFIFSPFGYQQPIFTIQPLEEHLFTATCNNPQQKDLFNKIDLCVLENCRQYQSSADFQLVSTPESVHIDYINSAKDSISEIEKRIGDPTKHTNAKIVAARLSVMELTASPTEIYHRLEALYPENFIFLFSSPQGSWIGASPEIILQSKGAELLTYSLAGTRPYHPANTSSAYSSSSLPENSSIAAAEPWDRKNLEEQQTVTDFICNLLSEQGLKPECEPLSIRRSGAVEHLLTRIHANLPANLATESLQRKNYLEHLLRIMSPTPALSGYPQKEAVDFINSHEAAPRFCYGGLVGYYSESGGLESYVNLRSGIFIPYDDCKLKIALYAGGGITQMSDAHEEWKETERKLSTMISAIT